MVRRAIAIALVAAGSLARADEAMETPSVAAEQPLPIGNTPPIAESASGFSFGSYGRVTLGLDGAGHEGYPVNVVAHGSRLEETPYLEIYLYYTGQLPGGVRWRAVITP